MAVRDPRDLPSFRSWFGASKVVDSHGRPLVMYHGTGADFSVFEIGDVGFHFGSLESAHERIRRKQADLGDVFGSPSIMPVYLAIQNPLRLPDVGGWDSPDTIAVRLGDVMLDDDDFERRYLEAVDLVDGCGVEDFRKIFQLMGYDGVVYSNVGEGGGDSWIAFRPEQIKSAIGSRFAYEGDHPDIRMSRVARGYERNAG